MNTEEKLGIIGILLMIIILGFGSFGYFRNIYRAVHLDFEPSYKAEAIRCVGIIIPPIGVIAGYVKFEEEY